MEGTESEQSEGKAHSTELSIGNFLTFVVTSGYIGDIPALLTSSDVADIDLDWPWTAR